MKEFIGELGSISPRVLLIGRRDDHSGLAEHSKMIGRMFGSYLPIEWLEVQNPKCGKLIEKHLKANGHVIFAEIPWHFPEILKSIRDHCSGKISGIFVWDSDEIPSEFVEVLSEFDDLITPTDFLLDLVRSYLPNARLATIPLALDNRMFAVSPNKRNERLRENHLPRIGTVASLHRRKNLGLIIDTSLELWQKGINFELLILSNLYQGNSIEENVNQIRNSKFSDHLIIIENDLNEKDYCEVIESIDIYISASSGEGFNIPARQALASGSLAILSDIPGHQDIIHKKEVISIPTSGLFPAVYPEFNNLVSGSQFIIKKIDLTSSIVQAIEMHTNRNVVDNIDYAINWDYRSLEQSYRRALFTPTKIPIKKKHSAIAVVGHDAGFFSLFNTFVSIQNVWQGENGFNIVIPDWRVQSIKDFWKTDKFTSFCYGKEVDGNIYFKLFDTGTQFPISKNEIEDQLDTALKVHSFNASADPNLTYVHADKLYRSAGFEKWRESMFQTLGGLTPNEKITNRLENTFHSISPDTNLIGMHVRHASHAMEQPDKKIAKSQDYINLSHELILKESIRNPGRESRIFLATDQQKVIEDFKKEFGDLVLTISNVARIDASQSEIYENLSERKKLQEGFQIQHQKASNESSWTMEMAEDVIADAWGLAKCGTMLHSVSNVATAVSFINPKMDCIPVYPDFKLKDIEELKSIRESTSFI